MNALWDLITREPVRTQALIQAFIGMLLLFGLDWSSDQVAGVMAFTALLLGWLTRELVTPVAKQERP